MTLAIIWAAIRRLAAIIIPVPLALIVGLGLWLWLDRSSAIRKAVNAKATEMIAGAEIEALKTRLATQAVIAAAEKSTAAEAIRRAAVADAARVRLEGKVIAIQTRHEGLADDLADLRARPIDSGCMPDADFFGRLRNN